MVGVEGGGRWWLQKISSHEPHGLQAQTAAAAATATSPSYAPSPTQHYIRAVRLIGDQRHNA